MPINWRRLFGPPPPPAAPIKPGLYHFTRTETDPPVRFHLRVDTDGGGLLLANASEAAVLSPVGVFMAHGILSGREDIAIKADVRAHFGGATDPEIADDLWQMHHRIDDLSSPDDNYPITNVGIRGESTVGRRLIAPHRAFVTADRAEVLEPVLRALWEAAIPHVTFLPTAQTPGEELVRLVECAEDLGMITGVRGLASWFGDEELTAASLAGLDYLTVVLASVDAEEHNRLVGAEDYDSVLRALKLCRALELCPVLQVPLTDFSAQELEEMVVWGTQHKVSNYSFFAVACLDGEEQEDAAGALAARSLPQVAASVTEGSESVNARFLWEPPVRFDLRRTLAEQIVSGPRAGSDASVRVEPDGSVYPPRGPRVKAGNLLQQEWAQIWAAPCFAPYREGEAAPVPCEVCPGLEICEAACPRNVDSWSDDRKDGEAS
ncbi:hypothetical protein LLH03_20650 [bacterium]|nr:hypothetical protein [bacterium]